MNVFISFLAGLVIGVLLGHYSKKSAPATLVKTKYDKVLKIFESSEFINNDDIEKALGVSDATATRYLQKLEDDGLIEQIGGTGRYVKYRLKK